jgi:hypothetical protein
MGPTSVIVAVNPLPPDDEVSMGVNADIVPICSTTVKTIGGDDLPIPVNMVMIDTNWKFTVQLKYGI